MSTATIVCIKGRTTGIVETGLKLEMPEHIKVDVNCVVRGMHIYEIISSTIWANTFLCLTN